MDSLQGLWLVFLHIKLAKKRRTTRSDTVFKILDPNDNDFFRCVIRYLKKLQNYFAGLALFLDHNNHCFECFLMHFFRKVVASRDSVEPGETRRCRVHGPGLWLERLEVLGLQH